MAARPLPIDVDALVGLGDWTTLGRGSFGTVYAATWQGKPIAVKCTMRPIACVELDPYWKEVQLHAQLVHPNIMAVLGVVEVAKQPPIYGIVMDRMECTLHALVYGATPPSARRRVELLVQVAEALTYLHSRDPAVIHMDLKPHNVLIGADGNARLNDFGLSHARSHSSVATASQFGMQGSARYMDTELIANRAVGTWCDVYSFGIMAWEVLTMQVPYARVPVYALVGQVDLGLRPPVNELPADVPNRDRVMVLLADCWQCDAASRPTAAVIAAELARVLCGGGGEPAGDAAVVQEIVGDGAAAAPHGPVDEDAVSEISTAAALAASSLGAQPLRITLCIWHVPGGGDKFQYYNQGGVEISAAEQLRAATEVHFVNGPWPLDIVKQLELDGRARRLLTSAMDATVSVVHSSVALAIVYSRGVYAFYNEGSLRQWACFPGNYAHVRLRGGQAAAAGGRAAAASGAPAAAGCLPVASQRGDPAHSLHVAHHDAAQAAASWDDTCVPLLEALRPAGPHPSPAATDAAGTPPDAVAAEAAATAPNALALLPPHMQAMMRNPDVSDQRKLQLCRFYAEKAAGSFQGHDGRFVILHGDGLIVPQVFDSEEHAAATAEASSGVWRNALLMCVGDALECDSRAFLTNTRTCSAIGEVHPSDARQVCDMPAGSEGGGGA
jgi:hypothetical protein